MCLRVWKRSAQQGNHRGLISVWADKLQSWPQLLTSLNCNHSATNIKQKEENKRKCMQIRQLCSIKSNLKMYKTTYINHLFRDPPWALRWILKLNLAVLEGMHANPSVELYVGGDALLLPQQILAHNNCCSWSSKWHCRCPRSYVSNSRTIVWHILSR